MFDLKALNSALEQLEEERGVSRAQIIEAIEDALAAAYKKDYGKKGQIIRAKFNPKNGEVEFYQVKIAVDEDMIKKREEGDENVQSSAFNIFNIDEPEKIEPHTKVTFNEEHHMMIDDAKKIKKEVVAGEELTFPLEAKGDYGRIAAQTAKQVIIQ